MFAPLEWEKQEKKIMSDLIYVGLTLLFLALSYWLIVALDRLME